MKSDEGIFKMLSNSSIIRNQYENVRLVHLTQNSKNPSFYWVFFYLIKKISDERMMKVFEALCFHLQV